MPPCASIQSDVVWRSACSCASSCSSASSAADPVAEDVAVACAGEDAVELHARNDEEPVDRVVVRDPPVISDGQDVVARARVVPREVPGRELAVRAVRVRMQGAAEPDAVGRPGARHRRESLVDILASASVYRACNGWSRRGESVLHPRHRSHTIDAFTQFTRGGVMEDHQEQEYEFWRRLEEEQLDRRKLLKRGLAAGAGLTIFSLSDVALAARQRALADPPMRGKAMSLKELIAEAKKENHLNTIALPPELGELRRDHGDVHEEVRHRDHERQPRRAPRRRRTRPSVRSRATRAPPTCSTSARRSRRRRQRAASTRSTTTTHFKKVPRAMKDGRGLLGRATTGAPSRSGQQEHHPEPAQDVRRPAQARVQEQGRA